MLAQVGLTFDFSAGFFLLFIILPAIFLFGCLFGILALISDSPARWKPWALAITAIVISAILFSLTADLDHGFTLGTFLGMVPGLLGTWAITQSLSRDQKQRANGLQFSTRLFLQTILLLVIILSVMAFFAKHTRARQRRLQFAELLTHAKLLIVTPDISNADAGASSMHRSTEARTGVSNRRDSHTSVPQTID